MVQRSRRCQLYDLQLAIFFRRMLCTTCSYAACFRIGADCDHFGQHLIWWCIRRNGRLDELSPHGPGKTIASFMMILL